MSSFFALQAMLLASGSADSSVCLWDLSGACKSENCGNSPSNKFLVGKLEGHEERVNRVAFHPTGTMRLSLDVKWLLRCVRCVRNNSHTRPFQYLLVWCAIM